MSKTTKPKAKLRITLLPARHGSKVPKTKQLALRLLGLSYSDLHKRLDRKKPKLFYPRSYLTSSLYMPPGLEKALADSGHSSDEALSIMAGIDINEIPRLGLEQADSIRYRDKNYNFVLTATRTEYFEDMSELPLTFLSGSKKKTEKRSIQEEEFFSIQEAADKLRVNYATIRKLIKTGELEAAKVGGVWRVTGTGIINLMTNKEEKES
jgi:excisionase family DNA binding protein